MAFNFALQGTISSRVDFGRHPNKATSRPWEHFWKVPFAGMTPFWYFFTSSEHGVVVWG